MPHHTHRPAGAAYVWYITHTCILVSGPRDGNVSSMARFDELSDLGLPQGAPLKLTGALFHSLLPHQLFVKPVSEGRENQEFQREGKWAGRRGWRKSRAKSKNETVTRRQREGGEVEEAGERGGGEGRRMGDKWHIIRVDLRSWGGYSTAGVLSEGAATLHSTGWMENFSNLRIKMYRRKIEWDSVEGITLTRSNSPIEFNQATTNFTHSLIPVP